MILAQRIKLSVIIPHLNQHELLRKCVRSVEAQVVDVSFEIIVADNGSTITPDISEFAVTRLVCETEPGPGPARNLAIAEAKGEIVAFLDSDCIAPTNWLASIAAQFEMHPSYQILGGDVLIEMPQDRPPSALEAYEAIFTFRHREMITRHRFASTSNMAVRRDVFDAVGGFGGIGIAEDRDWGQRATALGFAPHFIEDMIIYHPARTDFAALAEKWDRHIVHDLNEYRKGQLWWLRWLARTLAVAISPAAAIPTIARATRLKPAAKMSAFGMLIRVRCYRARKMLLAAIGIGDTAVKRWNS